MQREIKFRVFDLKEKVMYQPVSLANLVMQNYELESLAGDTLPPKDFRFWFDDHVMLQFTGLRDKNDREIYEGDVVKGVDVKDGDGLRVNGQSDVFYHTGRWQPFDYLHDFSGRNFEVIGNIYENPELLK